MRAYQSQSTLGFMLALLFSLAIGCDSPADEESSQSHDGSRVEQSEYPIQIDSGWGESCALMNSGRVYCWGLNEGNLFGITEKYISHPTPVPGFEARDLAMVQGVGMCLTNLDGEVWCNRFRPGEDAEVKRYAEDSCHLDSEGMQACSISCTGALSCWSLQEPDDVTDLGSIQNQSLALGAKDILWLDGSDQLAVSPQREPFSVPEPNPVVRLRSVLGRPCATFENAGEYCLVGETGAWVEPAELEHHAVDYPTSCELRNRQVYCWGENYDGTLGADPRLVSETTRQEAVAVPVASDVLQLAQGFTHTCVLTAENTVECWGLRYHGQLGDGVEMAHNPPTRIGNRTHFRRLLETDPWNATCAQEQNGATWCWGVAGAREYWLEPKRVPILDGISAFAEGCAKRDGVWSCYEEWPPTDPVFSIRADSIVKRHSDYCWLSTDGKLDCFNPDGQVSPGLERVLERLPEGTSLEANDKGLCVTTGESLICEYFDGSSPTRVPMAAPLFVTPGLLKEQGGPYYVLRTPNESPQVYLEEFRVPEVSIKQVTESGVCALSESGDVWCRHDYDVPGRPGRDFPIGQWARMSDLPSIDTLIGRWTVHTCALDQDGAVWCWGSAGDAALANGVINYRWQPGEVRFPEPGSETTP